MPSKRTSPQEKTGSGPRALNHGAVLTSTLLQVNVGLTFARLAERAKNASLRERYLGAAQSTLNHARRFREKVRLQSEDLGQFQKKFNELQTRIADVRNIPMP